MHNCLSGCYLLLFIFLKILFIYFREGMGGRKRRRETSMCGCLLHTPILGTWPATPWFTGWHSIHWATAARDGPPFCSISCSSAALAHVRLEPLCLPGGSTLSSLDNTPSQSPVISLVPWSPLSDPNIATPAFLWLMFTRLPFFIL